MKRVPRIIRECKKCGKEFQFRLSDSRRERGRFCSRSCGASFNSRSHGLTGSKTYYTWTNMRQRCQNPKAFKYPQYGGAGIDIDPRWNKFANFLADMGERPEGHTLDRIDGTKGYSKENCRWATPPQQQRNIRTNVMVTFRGETLCLKDWANKLGLGSIEAVKYRIRVWGVERALTTPPTR